MAAIQVDLGPLETEAVLTQSAVHVHRHRRQSGRADVPGHVHPVGQHTLQREGARGAVHRDVAPGERPAKLLPVPGQIEPGTAVDDGDGARRGGGRAGFDVAGLHALGRQHVLSEAPVELHLEGPGMQSLRGDRAVPVEAVQIPGSGDVTGDDASGLEIPQALRSEHADRSPAQWKPVRSFNCPLTSARKGLSARHDVQRIQVPEARCH